MFMNHWFTSSYHREPQYIGRATDSIDEQFLKQHPPLEFSRPPRSIQKHLSYWKASELRNWLLYFSLPLLVNHLPPLYWHHCALLVCTVHVLLKDKLHNAEVDAAEQMLWDFYTLLPGLYGEKCCTANAHLLSHLAKYVRLWGPLWTHSSFGYENKNGHIKHFIHNKSDVVKQLLFNLDVNLTLQQLYPNLEKHESDQVLEFLSPCAHVSRQHNMYYIANHMYAVGKLQSASLTTEQAFALGTGVGTKVELFTRLYAQGVLYHSTSYHRSEGKRNSTMCKFATSGGEHSFGQIHAFIAHPFQCALVWECTFCPITLMEQAGPPSRDTLQVHKDVDILNSFIKPFLGYTQLRAVPLQRLLGKAVFLSGTDCNYIAPQPNSWEHH